jgi:hypothetical protein
MVRAELNDSLKQALAGGTPVEVVDAVSGQVYYVISAEQFHVARGILSGDFNPREAYPLIDKVMAADDACDPWLESYQ